MTILSKGDFMIKIDFIKASLWLSMAIVQSFLDISSRISFMNFRAYQMASMLHREFSQNSCNRFSNTSVPRDGNRSLILTIFLCISASFEQCQKNEKATTELLCSLSFSIKNQKSVLTPSQLVEFLGLRLNSKTMFLELPEQNQQAVRTFVT